MKLSIITINKNNKQGLIRTVKSVQNQTWRDFEHIVIDGHSVDGSKEYVMENEKLFSFCVSEPDSGVYEAMNKGIIKASGKYLLFLNSGDTLINNSVLNRILSTSPKEDLIIGRSKTHRPFDPSTLRLFDYVFRYSLPHPATFIKKDLFTKVGYYNEQTKITADWQFFMKALFLHNASYEFVDVMVAEIEEGGLSRSSGSRAIIREEKMKFMEENPEMRNMDFVRSYFQKEELLFQLSRSRIIRFLTRLGFLKYLKKLF